MSGWDSNGSGGVVGAAESGRPRSVRRAGLAVADQAVSSLGNIVLTLIVAHALAPAEFGAYALVVATYQIATTLGQALVGEPLLVLAGRTDRRDVRGALALSTLLGVASGLVLVVAWLIIGDYPALLALAALMPGLLLQDALRFAAFAVRRPQLALWSDLVWTLGQFGATAAVLAGTPTVTLLILAWGLPALPGALVAAVALVTWPQLSALREWHARSRHLTRQYVAEAATNLGSFQAVLYLTGALAGLAPAGQLRLVQVLFGPVHISVNGARAFGIPEISRRIAGGRPYNGLVLVITGVLGLLSALWTVALGLADKPAAALIGAGWVATGGLIWVQGLQKTLECAATGPFLVHRAKERARWTFHVRAVSTGVTLAATLPLAPLAGATGASWAMVAGSAIAAFAYGERWVRRDLRAAPVSVGGRVLAPAGAEEGR